MVADGAKGGVCYVLYGSGSNAIDKWLKNSFPCCNYSPNATKELVCTAGVTLTPPV